MATRYILIGVAVIVALVLFASTIEPIEEAIPEQIKQAVNFGETSNSTVGWFESNSTHYDANNRQLELERERAIEQQLKAQQDSIDKQQAYNCIRHTGLDYC